MEPHPVEPEPRTSRTDPSRRAWWAWIVGPALVSFVIGFGVGAVTLGAGSGSTAGSMGGVPPVCLQAIRAARAELGLRSELPQAYVQLFQRAVDAVRRGDTAALEEIAGELQDLNRRAQQGAQATLGDAFSRPARACESLSPGPPTPSAATASG